MHRGATVALRCNSLHRYESACGFSALEPHRMGGRVLTVPCNTNVRLVDPWTTYPSSTPLRQSLRASPRGVGRVLDLFFKYPQSSTRVCPLKHPGLVPDGVPLSTPTTSTPSAGASTTGIATPSMSSIRSTSRCEICNVHRCSLQPRGSCDVTAVARDVAAVACARSR